MRLFVELIICVYYQYRAAASSPPAKETGIRSLGLPEWPCKSVSERILPTRPGGVTERGTALFCHQMNLNFSIRLLESPQSVAMIFDDKSGDILRNELARLGGKPIASVRIAGDLSSGETIVCQVRSQFFGRYISGNMTGAG
jgi:hypothetical protein